MRMTFYLFDNKIFKPVALLFSALIFLSVNIISQPSGVNWSADGNAYFKLSQNQIIKYTLPGNKPLFLYINRNS